MRSRPYQFQNQSLPNNFIDQQPVRLDVTFSHVLIISGISESMIPIRLRQRQFKRDYKLAIKRGCDPKKLEEVITLLCNEQPLPEAYRDHALTNSRNYKDMRECHIEPDWLLVYKVVRQTLILKLIRTGSHSDLF